MLSPKHIKTILFFCWILKMVLNFGQQKSQMHLFLESCDNSAWRAASGRRYGGGFEEVYQNEYLHWVREPMVLAEIKANQCVYN